MPAGLILSAADCSSSAGVQTCEWTISEPMRELEGSYTIHTTVTDINGQSGSAHPIQPESRTTGHLDVWGDSLGGNCHIHTAVQKKHMFGIKQKWARPIMIRHTQSISWQYTLRRG